MVRFEGHKRISYNSPRPAALATTNANANLEPVLQDGLQRLPASVTFEKTFAASRSYGPAVVREFREIFSQPRFEEIFDGHFRRDPDPMGSS
jgi:hypothetical protein